VGDNKIKFPTLKSLAAQFDGLKNRLTRNEKDVRSLKDVLNVHDNWASTTRDWIGKDIKVFSRNQNVGDGKLLWVDRYNMAVAVDGTTRIYNKGAVDWLELKE
jgi:hypothetical protein